MFEIDLTTAQELIQENSLDVIGKILDLLEDYSNE